MNGGGGGVGGACLLYIRGLVGVQGVGYLRVAAVAVFYLHFFFCSLMSSVSFFILLEHDSFCVCFFLYCVFCLLSL